MLLRQHTVRMRVYTPWVSFPRVSVLPEVEECYVFTTCLYRKPSIADVTVPHVTVVALGFPRVTFVDAAMYLWIWARPHSAPRGRVWDVDIELLVTQEFN